MPTKILVVDDEPDLEIMITQKFRKQVREKEMLFEFASNGAAALVKLEAQPDTHVILTDINMPEMDGLTLLGKVREQYPLVKTVIVSAYGDMSNIRSALNRGAFDFVTKPLDFTDLDITLNKAIYEAHAFQRAAQEHDQLVAIQQELEVARHIQKTIVPRQFPPFPERREFVVHAEMIPARKVGGDFYDFFLIDDDHLGFVIGDVSGKGVPAALFMAVSKTVLKATALRGVPPAECCEQINRILFMESVEEMFVTAFYGVLNTRTGEVAYCNAGHNPPYILRQDGHVEVTASTEGLMLGLLENWNYQAKQIVLKRGDGIILFTDGITEALDRASNLFSEARLEECLKRFQPSAVKEIVAGVMAEVETFAAGAPQADDMTVLSLAYLG